MQISWLKLSVNILNDEKIEILRSYPEGGNIFTLWIGLLCLAMKSCVPGCLYVAEGIPYTVDDLVRKFNLEKKTVEMSLGLFEKYGMIMIHNGGAMEIVNFMKYQAVDQLRRSRELTKERVRRYRERQKDGQKAVTSNSVTSNDLDKTRVDKKKIEKKEYASCVHMQPEEREKLVAMVGEAHTRNCITKLSDYKGSTGKTYKNDYLAIRNWVIEEVTGSSPAVWSGKKKTPWNCPNCNKPLDNEMKNNAHNCYSCDANIEGLT